ncbi:uncharacterized protein MYCFIDRAFT_172960 [Pseudocercospora fijiensis CIRAD86]|uniref:Uncharacterized protein n=1 Tax=Pseudocercospora fijiensis (strain CIRAD86) TaxID=383855 RepID=M2ZY57_PSEFD|nr:uncharacterized protein MYCFIDRAFT_172960 [Pseudocercospora fijiensis CIRAD86]EME83884.1 hypothetical protein MYCFIDRAFT_172960 [Pseudocercospora fijiensis CIRAD86]
MREVVLLEVPARDIVKESTFLELFSASVYAFEAAFSAIVRVGRALLSGCVQSELRNCEERADLVLLMVALEQRRSSQDGTLKKKHSISHHLAGDPGGREFTRTQVVIRASDILHDLLLKHVGLESTPAVFMLCCSIGARGPGRMHGTVSTTDGEVKYQVLEPQTAYGRDVKSMNGEDGWPRQAQGLSLRPTNIVQHSNNSIRVALRELLATAANHQPAHFSLQPAKAQKSSTRLHLARKETLSASPQCQASVGHVPTLKKQWLKLRWERRLRAETADWNGMAEIEIVFLHSMLQSDKHKDDRRPAYKLRLACIPYVETKGMRQFMRIMESAGWVSDGIEQDISTNLVNIRLPSSCRMPTSCITQSTSIIVIIMATDPLAMHALLEQLDQNLEAGKSYPDQAAQDDFCQQLIAATQLKNRSKSGQGGLHTFKSLREVVRYTLRGNKKAQYGPGGSDKKESQDALNHFFTIGSDMLKETYLVKLRAIVQKNADGASGSTTTTAGKSSAANVMVPVSAMEPTDGHVSKEEAWHGSTLASAALAEHQIASRDSAVQTRPFGPYLSQPTEGPERASKKRPLHDHENANSEKRIKREHEASRIVVLQIETRNTLEAIQDNELPTKSPRMENVQNHPRFPCSLPTPSLSPPPVPQPITSHRPPLGCVSQAEILEDIKSITTAISSFLGTPQLYSPSSPILATLLGNDTYIPSSPHLSCSPASHDSVWEWLIDSILSPDLPSTSSFLGMLSDASNQGSGC